MTKLYASFLCCLIFCSCSQDKTGNNIIINKAKQSVFNEVDPKASSGLMYDTLYDTNGNIKIDTIKYLTNASEITPLPFGYDFDIHDINKAEKFYSGLIYKNNDEFWSGKTTSKALEKKAIYKLPPIKKIRYIQLFSIDSNRCNDGKPFSNYLKLTKYRYRLPDINHYQCYYWSDDSDNRKYPEEIKKNCEWCLLGGGPTGGSNGYLVLYNPESKVANVMAIYFNIFRDGSDDYRYFYIDKNYNIHLVGVSQNGDDGNESSDITPSDLWGKTIISISKYGEIVIKKIK